MDNRGRRSSSNSTKGSADDSARQLDPTSLCSTNPPLAEISPSSLREDASRHRCRDGRDLRSHSCERECHFGVGLAAVPSEVHRGATTISKRATGSLAALSQLVHGDAAVPWESLAANDRHAGLFYVQGLFPTLKMSVALYARSQRLCTPSWQAFKLIFDSGHLPLPPGQRPCDRALSPSEE